MDELKKGLNNISLYDVKSYVRKAQNVVYNYTDMEAKVREATNNEPWGASSTLMQKIAAGTYNYREREEIVGMIFRRFTEKASNEWRQIYKALQLLEYLIKNGSERLVDDARSNLSIIQMLRSFHYIDSKGRDQGINVRNKSKNLIELLNNDTALRAERKKSRENANKFKGVAGGVSSRMPRDDDDYGSYENRIFGDGGVYGQRFEEARASGRKDFEEYDVSSSSSSSQPPRRQPSSRRTNSSKPVPAKPAQPTVDLFSFDDPVETTTNNINGNGKTTNNNNNNGDDDDDEFGDFQTSTQPASTQAPSINNNLSNLYAQTSHQRNPSAVDNTFGDFALLASNGLTTSTTPTSSFPATNNTLNSGPRPAASKQDAFSSLFQSASSQAHSTLQPKPRPNSNYSNLAKSTTTTNHYTAQPQPQQQKSSTSNGEINLLDL